MFRAACLILLPSLMLLYQYLRLGTLRFLTSDGRLYLSIADNFLATGHFIQTERWFSGFVVPPGTPLVLLLLRALRFTEGMITGVQPCLFGLSCLMLGETEKKLFGHYGAAPFVYLLGYMRCRLMLSNILVEHYHLFLLCLLLWLVFCSHSRRKLLWMNLAGFWLLLTRPALSPVYIVILGYTVWTSVRGHRISAAAAVLLLPAAALAINFAVNYRETGERILLQSYSGADLYITACPHAPVTIEEGLSFVDETRDAYFYESDLSMNEISRELGAMAKAFVREHPMEYLGKTALRFHEMFLKSYAWLTLLPAIGAVLLIRHQEDRRTRALHLFLFGMNLLLAVLTSFGIPEIRYTAVIWPLASLHFAALTHDMIGRRFTRSGENYG